MGVAWHGHTLAWFEIGRTEWMRLAGLPYGALEDERGVFFPVIEVGATYRAPVRYDEELDVETILVEARGVRVRFEYRIVGVSDGRQRSSGFTMHAAVGRDGRPQRLSADLRSRLLEGADDSAVE